MSTHTHDNLCDTGEKCEMCAETAPVSTPCENGRHGQCPYGECVCWCHKSTPMTLDVHDTETCHCSMCHWADQQEREVTLPTFQRDWEGAPRIYRRLITEADAEYFWLRGQQAGRIAEQVETRRWLAQMMEGYDERVGR